jgi:hypothetical protein
VVDQRQDADESPLLLQLAWGVAITSALLKDEFSRARSQLTNTASGETLPAYLDWISSHRVAVVPAAV